MDKGTSKVRVMYTSERSGSNVYSIRCLGLRYAKPLSKIIASVMERKTPFHYCFLAQFIGVFFVFFPPFVLKSLSRACPPTLRKSHVTPRLCSEPREKIVSVYCGHLRIIVPVQILQVVRREDVDVTASTDSCVVDDALRVSAL